MKTKIYVPDIECDSCSKLLTRSLGKKDGITDFSIDDESISINFENDKITESELIEIIQNNGFRAATEPFDRMTFKERKRHYKENKHKYELESKVIKYATGLFLILAILDILLYFTFLKNIPNFIQNYGLWIFYLNLSVSTLGVAIWHVSAYKAKVTCMTGMMIGMTVGMQTGMMIGAVLGATNGFFIGAMSGMLLGTGVGVITGKCCGVMGVMEGMMAGVMGGTMGAMITVMMFSDNIQIFMPFYMLINVIIVLSLPYMMYEEVVEKKKGVKMKPLDFTSFTSIAVVATIILLAIIIYGPKSAFLGF